MDLDIVVRVKVGDGDPQYYVSQERLEREAVSIVAECLSKEQTIEFEWAELLNLEHCRWAFEGCEHCESAWRGVPKIRQAVAMIIKELLKEIDEKEYQIARMIVIDAIKPLRTDAVTTLACLEKATEMERADNEPVE